MTIQTSDHETQESGPSENLAQDENEEHVRRVEDMEKQSMEWLHERARASGIPDWNKLSKDDLVQRLSDSSAPAH